MKEGADHTMSLCIVGWTVDREYGSARADAYSKTAVPQSQLPALHCPLDMRIPTTAAVGDGCSFCPFLLLHNTPLSVCGLTSYPTIFAEPPINYQLHNLILSVNDLHTLIGQLQAL